MRSSLPVNMRSASIDHVNTPPDRRRLRAWLAAFLSAAAALLAMPFGAAAGAESSGCPGADVGPGRQSQGRADEAILCLVDRERESAGRAPLRADGALGAAATRHSEDMVARDYFGHVAPSGSTPPQRARIAGFCRRVCLVSENIAWGTGSLGTPAATVAAWMRSSEHRANLLAPGARLTGIGVAYGAPGQRGGAVTVTEDFAH